MITGQILKLKQLRYDQTSTFVEGSGKLIGKIFEDQIMAKKSGKTKKKWKIARKTETLGNTQLLFLKYFIRFFRKMIHIISC
jgi:hypothetical protein